MPATSLDLAAERPAPREQPNGSVTLHDGGRDSSTNRMRSIGVWSARAICLIKAVYVVVFVIGFASLGNIGDPLPDPYLAIGEVLIFVMAPIMVALMLAIHQFRRGLIAGGSLCLIGLSGPFANAIAWREFGILGYTIVFGLTCLPLSRAFKPDTRPLASVA